MKENEIAEIVFELAVKVHKTLGAGLLESTYEECLYYELQKSGLKVERQKALPIIYEDVKLEIGYRVDLIVENKVILELKSVEELSNLHKAQLLTYLKLSGCKLGLLMNFNVEYMGKGVKRIINGFLKDI